MAAYSSSAYSHHDIATVLNKYNIVYGPLIAEQLNSSANAYNLLGEDTDGSYFGQGYRTKVEIALNERGGGWRALNGTIPTASTTQWNEIIVQPKFLYHAIKIAVPSIYMSKGNGSVGPDLLVTELKNAAISMKHNLAVSCYGTGNGHLAEVHSDTGTTATLTIYVKHPNGMTWLRPYGWYDIYDGTTKNASSVYITNMAFGNDYDTITIDGTESLTFTDSGGTHFIREGEYSTTDLSLVGFKGQIDDGTYGPATWQNITVSGTWYARSVVDSNSGSGRDITLMRLQNVLDRLKWYRGDKGEGDLIMLSGPGQVGMYWKLLQPQVRYMDKKFSAGYDTVDFHGLKWFADEFGEKGLIYFVDKKYMKKVTLKEAGVDDSDGQTVRRQTGDSRTHVLEGDLFYAGNIIGKRRNAHAVITDLNEPIDVI